MNAPATISDTISLSFPEPDIALLTLDTPGKGIMYMSDLDHVATYIPENVLESAQQTA